MKYLTEKNNFFKNIKKEELLEKYGSPLYVYNEDILLERIKDMKNLVKYKNFKVNYSAKANTSLGILQIVENQALHVDAMSMGEIFLELEAGFSPERIFFISNNTTEEEFIYAFEKGIMTSVDSLSQLELVGKIFKEKKSSKFDGRVAIRINSGVGAGHHEKVVTGGKKTKFGINTEYINEAKKIAEKYSLKIVGVNQHIGSLFLDGESYIAGAKNIINIAKQFEDLEFVDLGGGFGIPYNRQNGEKSLDINQLGNVLTKYIADFVKELGKEIVFKIEPGRYISCECGVILGTVTSTKYNGDTKYIGCDVGFNVLQRPLIYDSYHEIEIYSQSDELEQATVVGNICESGDILCKDRLLPKTKVGDLICINDAGAYGFTMASNYNQRLRPAEVMIRSNGDVVLLRDRDTLDSLISNQHKLF